MLYIHIPFCESRCIYCGFYSSTLHGLKDRYVDALCHEMTLRADYLPEGKTDSIYLGGGTPSTLSSEHLRSLFYNINKVYGNRLASDVEITIECNPDDVTEELCMVMKEVGINRVSMGVQTFDAKRLSFLRRRHSVEDVERAVVLLRNEGIANISLDLMFGFPEQTLENVDNDLTHLLFLSPNHISAYSLMYEEGTQLEAMLSRGEIAETEDETCRDMYYHIIDRLTGNGYEHYEISNFARPGFRSRHNSHYWQMVPYLGLGAAAHSFNLDSRQWNVCDVRKYIESIEGGKVPFEKETLDTRTRYNDLITTALRTKEGLSIDYVRSNFPPEYADYLFQEACPLIAKGLLMIEDNCLSLSREALYVSNDVLSDLIMI